MRLSIAAFLSLFLLATQTTEAGQPNLIWIMADDLGYGELGCYGQKVIHTPCLDRMAAEGMQLHAVLRRGYGVRALAACSCDRSSTTATPACAAMPALPIPRPRRLKPGDVTVAGLLKGPATVPRLVGKWGLGDIGAAESGLPRKHGFDYFFGYLNQGHAHNHYPAFLWRNDERGTPQRCHAGGRSRRRLCHRGQGLRRRSVCR